MRIIHSSDWHLGRSLYGRKRYEEHEAFLEWLLGVLESEAIDVLLVAGDIFDNTAPSNRAQEIYYRFLCRVAESSCRHVVITAGNHDSPSFLNAPRELLRHLNVHIVGAVGEREDDEVLVLEDAGGRSELIVCAVPYLRDRDIRTIELLERAEDKERKLLEGIRDHYARVCQQAEQLQSRIGNHVPIVAMGHLFAAGGRQVEGDGVRELYVGTLARVGADIFPASVDYAALGHLHSPQLVGGRENCRYSGSPLPMSFAEGGRAKTVVKVLFDGETTEISTINIPLFRELRTVHGNLEQISEQVEELKLRGSRAWLEIIYEGAEIIGDLRERLEDAVITSGLEILRLTNRRTGAGDWSLAFEGELLNELGVNEVFERCLEANAIPSGQREQLRSAYREIINLLATADWMQE